VVQEKVQGDVKDKIINQRFIHPVQMIWEINSTH